MTLERLDRAAATERAEQLRDQWLETRDDMGLLVLVSDIYASRSPLSIHKDMEELRRRFRAVIPIRFINLICAIATPTDTSVSEYLIAELRVLAQHIVEERRVDKRDAKERKRRSRGS